MPDPTVPWVDVGRTDMSAEEKIRAKALAAAVAVVAPAYLELAKAGQLATADTIAADATKLATRYAAYIRGDHA